MLGKIVASVLNNYVGEYLENLNADQLSIAILQGQVELENVPLKKTALRKFDVPLQVKSGVIGKLSLSIPITRMRSEPWILKISDLLILLGPSDQVYDASDVEGYEQTKKAQLLEALEAHHKAQLSLNFGLPLKDEATQNQYWGASLVSAVSNNIQLILSNVHIRYEDSTTMPNQVPFNFGIRIQHISIQTTNSHWKQEFVQPSEGVNTFKKLDIKGFSVFWNTHQEVHQTLSTPAELKAAMLPESSKSNQFILQPFSMQARMEKNTSKFPLKTLPLIPRFKFDLRPEKISIEITKKQLAQIRLLSREWARYERARQHRKWRPVIGIKEKDGAKAWWKFAINGIVNETRRNRERSTLNFLYTRAKHFNLYCKAYKKSLEAYIADQQTAEVPSSPKSTTPEPLPISLTAEDKAFMKQIEHDSQYSYHELHVFREVVFRQLMRQKEDDKGSSEGRTPEPFEVVTPTTTDIKNPLSAVNNQDNNEQSQGIYGWVSSWFGSASNNKEESKNEEDVNEAAFLEMWPNAENKKLPPNLRKIEKKVEEEILDVLNESWDDSTILRRDNLLAEVVFRLERIIIRFIDEEPFGNSRVLAMDWRQVACRVQLSPREHRTEISLSVGDMSVHRMKMESHRPSKALESDTQNKTAPDDDENDLFFGFSKVPKFSSELLFAIGRSKEDVSDTNGCIVHQKLKITKARKIQTPLFQLLYRRTSPSLDVLHELEAKFASISLIYDEDAFLGLADFFDTETALIEPNSDVVSMDMNNLACVGETHCDLNFTIPSIMLELRSRRMSSNKQCSRSVSTPFATARLSNVKLGISKTGPFVSILKMNFDSLIFNDLYEKNATSFRLMLALSKFEYVIGQSYITTFQINVDYYNSDLSGWEPFIEPWNVDELTALWKHGQLHLCLRTERTLNFNITPALVEQWRHFYSKLFEPYFYTDVSPESQNNFVWDLFLPAGIGISLINNNAEELIYARFQGIQLYFCRKDKTYQLTGHVNLIQVDNQLLTTERWQVLYCSYNALKNGEVESSLGNESGASSVGSNLSINLRPAMKVEMNCTSMDDYDVFDCFRVKLCDMCLLLDEILLWKIIQFMQQADATDIIPENSLCQLSNVESDKNAPSSEGVTIRKCYFGTLDLEIGNIALTVLTVAKNGLTKDLQELKRQFNIKLVSFENALITLPPFRQFHYFETLNFLIESLSKFYMTELQKQTINIVFTMDAFGNLRGLAIDLKESFQGLIFEADVTGFAYGLGYGVINSFSKVASSMSHGVGSLTFDEQHERVRSRMMKNKANNNSALSHFCNGIKGLGVGIVGGLTAIADNTAKTTKKEGVIAGITKGLVTGAVDTVTKPTQGFFDFLEGTASAVKEVVRNHSSRKSRFPEHRIRLPRVCTNLRGLLPVYSTILAEAQQEYLKIIGCSNNEMFYDAEVVLRFQANKDHVEQKVLICSEQCYCLRQINDSPPSVIQRISYRSFKNIFIDTSADVGKDLVCITVTYDEAQKSMPNLKLVCGDKETAKNVIEKILLAKNLFVK